jgi:hypothetical protein
LNLTKLKEKWGVKSNYQLLIIFIVFSITGSMSVKIGQLLLFFFNITPESFLNIYFGNVLYWIIRVLLIFPVYQVLLILFGALFFQFDFFWNFEKKILKKIGFKKFL